MLAGSLFHSVGPAQANARRPKRSRSSPPAERRQRRVAYWCGKVLWCAFVECLVHKDEYLILNPSLNGQPV